VNSPRNQHDEHSVAPRDRPLDDITIIRRSQDDSDPVFERGELPHTLLPAHAHHSVAAIQGVLNHVLAELPRASSEDRL